MRVSITGQESALSYFAAYEDREKQRKILIKNAVGGTIDANKVIHAVMRSKGEMDIENSRLKFPVTLWLHVLTP